MQDERMGQRRPDYGDGANMRYHIISFFGGFLLDLILGDPQGFPHPVRLIGLLINETEKRLYGNENEENESTQFWKGAALVLIVLAAAAAVSVSLLLTAYTLHPFVGVAVEMVMTYQILAIKCLRVESMKVCQCLEDGDLNRARLAVSMIVGRDTDCLDEEGVAKAAVETVAENTSDGVIAPMLYAALGGPVLGFLYKAVNTMDSMIGYKNDRYLYFGRAAARLDDAVNYIPSRISACLMMTAACLGGKRFSGKRAFLIYKRDAKNHASPNSAQTESVCAGALGIRLGGDASYFGKKVRKPYIGDDLRKAGQEDIRLANHLMYLTAGLCEILCLALLLLME